MNPQIPEIGNDAVSVTPKAFTNFSPGLERSDNPGIAILKLIKTLKAFGDWRTLSEFHRSGQATQGSRSRSNLGLKLANAFGVTSPSTQTASRPADWFCPM
ncbi:MAG TPA: hypothetical protein VJ875_06580 [Pyrinomonadaceae bacterium]|nr:hypothetical protein [Pyrinomonadaceae bacterium]